MNGQLDRERRLPGPRKQFRTFGAHPNAVRFIAYGDTRTNPKTHAAVAANFKRHTPEFILHTGDLVNDGRRYTEWGREFFGPLADVIDEIPILPAVGNHEQDGLNYLHYLHLPGKERWYAYDVGPVHVLSLDYRFAKKSQEQFAFARHDLVNSRAPWKIVFLHYPVFNIGGHGTGWGHDSYLPLFHQTKVDLVLAGHSHIYERFRPVAPRRGAEAWPITFITTGGGGAPLYAAYTHPALASRVATNHFLLIEATPTTLKGRAITTNDTVFDAFELTKSGGLPSPEYIAQVYPEETLKLSFEVSSSLTAELASVPTTNSPAQVMFTLRRPKSAKVPVELEIGLTPDSAVNYEIEGGPPRVTIPLAAKSNQALWASVRATGKRTITAEGKDKVLAPPLIFQAKIIAAGEETFAYGQKCKVSGKAAAAAAYRPGAEGSR
ncbi:MAG: metallophosphoesterase [Verrucomicrobia bacterium]|nr:metallophosphoesterase [Verrucomicrobiota bacterium]